MKYLPSLLVISVCSVSTPSFADIFFTEYVEGSSNNKALELYNNTGSAVDLYDYQIKIYFNGNTSPGTTLSLSGTLNDADAYVISDNDADSEILSKADFISTANSFNGDDAIELINKWKVIDAIGQVGVDLGSQWGSGDTSTKDKTMRRKVSIISGDSNSADTYDPLIEWDGFSNNTFAGLGDYSGSETPEPVLFALIHEVQGNGTESPMIGQIVTVEAIVVGDFQNNAGEDNGDLSGFYIQEEDSDADADTGSSEGIFVYDSNGDLDVSIGDKVVVTGLVKEFSGLTEISAHTIEINSQSWPLPQVSDISLPMQTSGAFEAFEGMRVRFSQSLVISEYYNYDRFGEIVLAQPLDGEQRPMPPTAIEQPGSDTYTARNETNQLSRITLDDGRISQNPDPAYHPNGEIFDLDNRFRGGDEIQNSQGIMDHRFSLYRLQPTAPADYIVMNPRPEKPPFVGNGVKVASLNVLNYFTTLDESGNRCGPNNNLECRGADNSEEFMRQRDKIIQAIASMDADIVGLIEIENNASAAIDDLLNGLNDVMGENMYEKIDTGFIGDDAIKVGFIYKPAQIQTIGDFAILDSTVDSRFPDDKNRPALAQTFISMNNAGRMTVVVNHFKSKGSDCDDLGDTDQGDGQGNCNLTRTAAAEALSSWLASDPTHQGDSDILIIGDLNAYDKEDPITALTNSGYTNLILDDEGETAYTYVFNGQFGYLDYALANTSLTEQVSAAKVWHINTDEPDILDYDTSFKKPAQDLLYEANAFRSSDHDPVLIGLELVASVEDIMAFFNGSVLTGNLQGQGRNPERSLRRFEKILTFASLMEQYDYPVVSCVLLRNAALWSGNKSHHRGLLQGDSLEALITLINGYRSENCR